MDGNNRLALIDILSLDVDTKMRLAAAFVCLEPRAFEPEVSGDDVMETILAIEEIWFSETHFSKAPAAEIEARAESKSFHKNLRARRFNKVKSVNRYFPISPAFERFGGHLTSWKFVELKAV